MEILPVLLKARYRYSEGPCTEGTCFDQDNLWINCQLYVHILLQELGYCLPGGYRSREIYCCGKYLKKVENPQELRVGDILLLSNRKPVSISDPNLFRIHLAICIDSRKQLISHATCYDQIGNRSAEGGIITQTLAEVLNIPRYNTLVGIRRVI